MAPEYIFQGQFSTKSDVYSFGVILLEIVSGQKICKPNQSQNNEGLLQRVSENGSSFSSLNFIRLEYITMKTYINVYMDAGVEALGRREL